MLVSWISYPGPQFFWWGGSGGFGRGTLLHIGSHGSPTNLAFDHDMYLEEHPRTWSSGDRITPTFCSAINFGHEWKGSHIAPGIRGLRITMVINHVSVSWDDRLQVPSRKLTWLAGKSPILIGDTLTQLVVFCWRRIYGPVELACFYHTCSKCYGMDCFGTYFTHAQTCNVTRVQSATEWTASVHTLHMSKPVM